MLVGSPLLMGVEDAVLCQLCVQMRPYMALKGSYPARYCKRKRERERERERERDNAPGPLVVAGQCSVDACMAGKA